jgi:hypothetical protein
VTTVVACRREKIVVSDSKCIFADLSFKTPKVKMARNGALVSAAGDSRFTEIFLKKYPRLPVVPAGTPEAEFQGLALTAKGIVCYDDKFNPLEVDEDYYAIGTGAMAVMAVIEAALAEGHVPNPMLAVEVACKIDHNSGLPVVVWDYKKGRRE